MDIIKLNGRDFPWEEGLTIAGVIEKKGFTYPKLIVKLNDLVIEEEDYESIVLNKGDDLKVIHLLAGG